MSMIDVKVVAVDREDERATVEGERQTGDEVMMSGERVEDFFIVFACLGKRDLT
jgi:hypothetical protein